MSLHRLPLLALLLTALVAATGAHAQSRAGAQGQTMLPVWNKGSGKVEAVLLLEPAGKAGQNRWNLGNQSLDAAFGLEAGDSLGLLCSSTSGANIGNLASRCLLASLGDEQPGRGQRLAATTSIGNQNNRLGFSAGTARETVMPSWLEAGRGSALAAGGRVEQNDLQVFGQKSLGTEAYVSIAGTYARARLIPLAEATPGLAERWDSKSLSVGGGYGPFSANIVGRVVDMRGRPGDNKWEGLGLGLTWRTPWSGQLTVGAENVITRGRNPFAPSNGEADEGTVPYVRYEQGL